MSKKNLYSSVTNCSNIESISVNTNHSSAVSVGIVNCYTSSLDIGNEVEIDLGYTNNHKVVFKGYVKQIDRKFPPGIYSITAQDVLIRAVDYFVVSSNPEDIFRRANILAEDLVKDVLALAGLYNYNFTATSFTFAVTAGVYCEVSLVSAYDYCKGISDILSWNLFADSSGTVHFVNRKPYVMTGTSGQPGDVADIPLKTINESTTLNISKKLSDRDLRNRVVVHGYNNLFAEEKLESPYLPSGYYKTVAMVWPILDSQTVADKAAEYNLHLLNRLNREVDMTVEGDPDLVARKVITLENSLLTLNNNYYIYACDHNFSKSGFVTNLNLRR